ncbi:Lrp/AsnC family transcriptional regulator [Ktedonospora formicarum]|uniref:AsnC family transcriptional regulator n=1 Tax=Ktedonospora formicarum TaxID=2778364 RepID=A0A8J3I512_9CHLR|nr:Lrp/AsnC family transcriptional regulator [Ktedonospora formicarum]GHO47198.1 AsnC family transcriptional regulator [Ktedonospora formicarum]GHO50305.1 AsnC family transcriptional regulator [Ktedonospora formicarum]
MTFKDDRPLDETGWSILRELQKDARLSFPELGRRVGLSTPAVAERVRKLEDAGVITGYGARVDAAKVGLPMTAFVRITTTPQTEAGLRALMAELPELLECHRVTGNESFLLKLVVTSITHLEQVLNQLMGSGPVTTSIVLSTPLSGEPIKQEATKREHNPIAHASQEC